MDSAVAASLIAVVGVIAVPIIRAAQQVQPYLWFERWSKVLAGAQTVEQKRIARERLDHHVRELAVRDRLRGVRRFYVIGAILGLCAVVLFGFGMAILSRQPGLGWLLIIIAAMFYILGLVAALFVPDFLRKRATTRVESIASTARTVSSRLQGASHRR